MHRKQVHTEKVGHCNNFSEGNCSFAESCWFIHDQSFKDSTPEYTCNICEKKLKTKTTLMKLKKENHIGTVATCRNYEKDCCTFGPVNCWFKHDDIHENGKNDNVSDNENHEVVKKLFDMMESFASRLVQIENNI